MDEQVRELERRFEQQPELVRLELARESQAGVPLKFRRAISLPLR